MKLIVELFYVEFRFKAFEKDSFFKSFHRSEKKIEFGLILTQILQTNPSKKKLFVRNERLIFL